MSFATSLRAARRRSLALAGLLAGGATTAVLAASPASAAGDSFAQLRQCESGGNYSTDTGNGFYGAYQFDLGTWHGLGYSGTPSSASPATQDAAAAKLQAQRGWQPWPSCSRQLGLSGAPSAAADVAASRSQPAESSRSSYRTSVPVAVPQASTGRHVAAPAARATGGSFTVAMVGQTRSDVRAWQQQMNALGYHLAVDGQYGPASAAATSAFERAHGLRVESVGIVGPQVRAEMARLLG